MPPNGVYRLNAGISGMAPTLYGDNQTTFSRGLSIYLCGRWYHSHTYTIEGESKFPRDRDTTMPHNNGTASKETKIFRTGIPKGRVPWLQFVHTHSDNFNSPSEGAKNQKASETVPEEKQPREIIITPPRDHVGNASCATTCTQRRQTSCTKSVRYANTRSKFARMGVGRLHQPPSRGKSRAKLLVAIPGQREGISARLFARRKRDHARCHRRGHKPHSRRTPTKQVPDMESDPLTTRKSQNNKLERAQSCAREQGRVPRTDIGNVGKFQSRQFGGSIRDKQMGHKATRSHPAPRPPPSMVTGDSHQGDSDLHKHTEQQGRGQTLSGHPAHKGGLHRVRNASPGRTSCETISTLAVTPDSKIGFVPSFQGETTSKSHRAPASDNGKNTKRILPHCEDGKALALSIYVPGSLTDPTTTGPHCSYESNSVSAVASMAFGALVRPSGQDDHKPSCGFTATSSNAQKSTQEVMALLELDWCTAIREAESKGRIPIAARIDGRLSASTQKRYSIGWRALYRHAAENPRVLQEIPEHCGKNEILARLLSSLATELAEGNKSAATYAQSQAAVHHFTQAANPSPEVILANTSTAYRRKHPAGATTKKVPDLHAMLDVIVKVPTEEADIRSHLMFLLLLLGGRRCSDYVRVFRDNRSMHFEVLQADLPTWARQHRSEAEDILRKLKLIPNEHLRDNEIITMNIRGYLGKTAQPRAQRYNPWHTFHENRFALRFCPILAAALYLNITNKYKLTTELKLADTTIATITDDKGRNPRPASPLLVSLNGTPRIGLQPGTMSGVVKRELLIPANIDNTAHITRATVASYKRAYGLSVAEVIAVGNWASESCFNKHYYRVTDTPISPLRLNDVQYHDWRITRAHVLSKQALPPLQFHSGAARDDTADDEAIARSMQGHMLQRLRKRK